MIKKLIFPFFLSITLITSNTEAIIDLTVKRAAIDIGSSGTKITIADVNPHTSKIEKIYFSQEVPVQLKRDMVISGEDRFSETIQQRLIKVLAQMQKDHAHYEPMEWSGIATAASRRAENAQELYDRIERELGILIKIIPQEEEGRLGFETAVTVSGIPEKNIISYDSGGASFQLSTKMDGKLQVVEGDFAYENAFKTLMEKIRGIKIDDPKMTPNPISVDEAKQVVTMLQARLPKMSDEFFIKLHDPQTTVVGIGNENFLFAHGAAGVGKKTYTKEELWEAIVRNCGKTDDELKEFHDSKGFLLGMILLYTVMDGMGIDSLTYAYANGSTEGLLIDKAYWHLMYIMSEDAI